MKLHIFTLFGFLSVFCLFLISCEDLELTEKKDENKTDTEQNETDSEENIDDEETADDEKQAESVYPEETDFSKKPGDTARNLTFIDEKNVEHKLAEWHTPNNEKSKLIWLIFSTYDCTYCNYEKKDIPGLNGKYAKKGLSTILIMNGYLGGIKPEEEPAKIAKLKNAMISVEGKGADHIYGYLQAVHQHEFRKFINSGYPVNIFIDAQTMEIIEHFEGWDKEDAVVKDVDSFIAEFLEGIE